jgi:two-component system chemotaxis sensor kinase CheA
MTRRLPRDRRHTLAIATASWAGNSKGVPRSAGLLADLTVAIIDGLLVGVGNDRYIIPTLSIRESFRPRAGLVSPVRGQAEVISVRGRQTPLLRLGRYLGTPFRAVNPEDGIVVVVESGDFARGLLVDELIGKQEVVIKSLAGAFAKQNILAGGAVLGDGSVGIGLSEMMWLRSSPLCS